MQRREAVCTLAGLMATGALANARAQAQPLLKALAPESTASIPTIDIHCHVFNARDLPIPGFVTEVYLNELPTIAGIAAGVAIWFLAYVMDAPAISARDEAERLRRHDESFIEIGRLGQPILVLNRVRATVERLLDRDPKVVSARQLFDARIARALASAAQAHQIPLKMPTPQEQQQFLRRLAGFGNPQFGTNPVLELTPAAVALGATKAPVTLAGVIYLAALLTRARAELTETLVALPTHHASDVRLFTPALVDYSYWLDDFEDVSPLQDQVDVMSAVAARKGHHFAVHPYISFCPWRQIVEPKQFDIVRQAIESQGFIGVKLYPVMGFLPIGNANADAAAYPKKLRDTRPDWAKALDAALTNLYEWCVKEEVPILVHCSDSQNPSAAAGLRGSPAGWAKVLATPGLADLRLDLGHLGGLWDLAKPTHNDWTQTVISMLAQSTKNLYADVSDYSSIMHRPGTSDSADDRKVSGAVKALLQQHPGAGKRIMYGSDWIMLSKDLPAELYYPSMRDRLPQTWGLDAPTFFGAGAARFLGLSKLKGQPTPKTRARLETFYDKNGLDKSVLALWDT
jgi:hypothetical protein